MRQQFVPLAARIVTKRVPLGELEISSKVGEWGVNGKEPRVHWVFDRFFQGNSAFLFLAKLS
jgi:hypothetical protein